MIRTIFLAFVLLAESTYFAFGQTPSYAINTFAGIGRPSGDNGPALSALLNNPAGIALDTAGNLYVAERGAHRIRKIDPTGRITTFAGNGIRGYSGDGGPAIAARMFDPVGIAVDLSGTVYFTDVAVHLVRKIAPDGTITTIAGTGTAGFSGDNGPAAGAQLNTPYAVAVQFGLIYIADTGNNRIRRISPTGVISTVAGTGDDAGLRLGGPGATTPISEPDGLAFDPAGNLYISEYGLARVLKLDAGLNVTPIAGSAVIGESGDSGPALQAALNGPAGLATDSAGAVYVADQYGTKIRKIFNGVITSVAGSGRFGFSGDGSSSLSAQFDQPFGLALDASGKLYVSDSANQRIRIVTLSSFTITTYAGTQGKLGDGGPALSAILFSPAGMTFDAAGNLFVADYGNNLVRKITPTGIISTVAGTGSRGFSGDGGLATSAQLLNPQGVAVDAVGNLYIADTGNQRIRRVNSIGTIQTIAGTGVAGFSGDGTAATLATFRNPVSIASDAAGNVYVADSGNNRIRRISSVGQISTYAGSITPSTIGDGGQAVAAGLLVPFGVALDSAGNLFIADTFHDRIRKVTPVGVISTVAGSGVDGFAGDGGSATLALLSLPVAVAVDSAGNLLIADGLNARVRQVTAAGVIRTIAGNGGFGFSGDAGPALQAQIGYLGGVAADAAGAVYVTDQDNHRIRQIAIPAVVPDFTFTGAFSGSTLRLTLTSINNFAGSIRIGVTGYAVGTTVMLAAGQSLTIDAPVVNLAAGGTLVYTADSAALHHEIPVAIVAPSGPVVTAAGVANGASYAAGPVAPGEIVTIYGAGMGSATLVPSALDAAGKLATTLAGTTVTFDGRPAPLLYVSATQLSAIVPYGLSGSAKLQVSYSGVGSALVSVPVVEAAPALFTTNSQGSGQAAVLNQDGSVNSPLNPAARGSVVVLFGTGEGETTPTGTDGQLATAVYPKPVLPVGVTIDGQAATVLYAGAAPGQVAGLFQINATVPDGASSGSVAISVQVGAQSSPRSTVMIAVR